MSTAPQEQTAKGNFWAEPAVRLDLAKYALGFIIPLIIGAFAMYYTQIAQGRDIARTQQDVAAIQQYREVSGNRITALETTTKSTSDDLKEIKADIKTLLNRRD